jgi:hypothetical protein
MGQDMGKRDSVQNEAPSIVISDLIGNPVSFLSATSFIIPMSREISLLQYNKLFEDT